VSHKIAVEVVYALPEKQYLQRVMLEENATVEDAIRASGLLELRSDIDLAKNKVGIYSRPVKLGDVLKEGDRVEIYRPLIADPKELRRQRAEKSGKYPLTLALSPKGRGNQRKTKKVLIEHLFAFLTT